MFDNPVISLEQNVYNRLNGKYFDVGKEGEAAIEIEQEIPIARQRSKRIKLEEINREAAGYRFEEVLRTLRSELYRSFVDTYYQSRSVRVYDREITSVGKLLEAVREQEGKGNMSRMEVSRLELFLLSLRKERQEAERQLVEMRGRLNLLLGAPAGHDRELVLDESILEKIDLSAVSFANLGTMLDSRPDVRAGPCRSACGRSECETATGYGGSRIFGERDVRPCRKLHQRLFCHWCHVLRADFQP